MNGDVVEVAICAPPGVFDDLVGLLLTAGFDGFWEDDGTLRCYRREPWQDGDDRVLATMLSGFGERQGIAAPTFSVCPIPARNWNEEWEKTITPLHVSDRITITPGWHTVSETEGTIVIVIDPKMSFGTGYHETTRLTLQLLEKYVTPGVSVMDVGTGTGVLAIAAVRLGAGRAIGCDTDEWAYANALENVERNRVGDRVEIFQGSLGDGASGPVDLLAANIQRTVLLELLPAMRHTLLPGGILLLSGLLRTDEQTMIDALHDQGFRLREELIENEWIAIAAVRHDGAVPT